MGHSVEGADILFSDALFSKTGKIFRNPADVLTFSTTTAPLNQGSLKTYYFTSKGFVISTALTEHGKYNLPLKSELFTCHGFILLS